MCVTYYACECGFAWTVNDDIPDLIYTAKGQCPCGCAGYHINKPEYIALKKISDRKALSFLKPLKKKEAPHGKQARKR
jgi:hypothetical protein